MVTAASRSPSPSRSTVATPIFPPTVDASDGIVTGRPNDPAPVLGNRYRPRLVLSVAPAPTSRSARPSPVTSPAATVSAGTGRAVSLEARDRERSPGGRPGVTRIAYGPGVASAWRAATRS